MQISLASVTTKPCEATSTEHFADRIFGLTPSASSTAITEGKDNVFQMCFADPNQGLASADYIADQKLGTKSLSSTEMTMYTPAASTRNSKQKQM